MSAILKLDRREFLKLSACAGGGLMLGVYLPDPAADAFAGAPFAPNVFVRIDPEGMTTIVVHKSDMGQGVRTALPMIIADELDADWDRVRVQQADAHPDRYGRQMTVGSGSVRGGAWLPLRQAGATARELLVAAAAARWGVPVGECRTESGQVIHRGSDRTLEYGALVEEAAKLPLPAEPRLKRTSEFRLIGRRVRLLDTPDRVSGRARFGLDVRLPGMLYATVVHPPVFGSSVRSFDAAKALAVPGVRQVFQVSQGVAVVAEHTWAAFQGAKALDIAWEPGGFAMSSGDIYEHFATLADGSAAVARSEGDAKAALAAAERRVEAIYEMPYLAHATMEPMNCTADVRAGQCEIWAPTQHPQGAQSAAAAITGLPLDAVTVHVTLLGCGWGRRSNPDFVRDAVEISKQVSAPVQLVWTREEDMQHDHYRPATYNRFTAALEADGKVNALRLRIVASPLRGGEGVDGAAVDGVAETRYAIPHLLVDYVRPDIAVPVGYWRSVGPSQNTFILESFIDELAHAAGRDPFELRRELLRDHPRLKRVLELAAEKAGWGTALPAGRGRGIAVVENKGGLVAEVAEVSLQDERVRVHRVTCAADFGQIIHPGIVEAQVTGSIVCGLTAALYGEITIEAGRVRQSNFHDYPLLRMHEMPVVDVHVIDSDEEPGGVGEPAVPPIAPAVANALFTLTGKRIRRLPINWGNSGTG